MLLLSLRRAGHDHNPQDPYESRNNSISRGHSRFLAREPETSEAIDQSSGNEHAPEPDVDGGPGRGGVIAHELQVVDVAEGGLEDEEHDDDDAEDRVEVRDLEVQRQLDLSWSKFWEMIYSDPRFRADPNTHSKTYDSTEEGQTLDPGMDPNQTTERSKADQERAQGEADDEGQTHDDPMNRDPGSIIWLYAARPIHNDDQRPPKRLGREGVGRVVRRHLVQIKRERPEAAIVMRINRRRGRVRLDGIAVLGRPDPGLSRAAKIHAASVPLVATSASDVRRHGPILNAGSREESEIAPTRHLRHLVPGAETVAEGDVVVGSVGVDDEHVGVFHLAALSEGDPGLGGGALDLEVEVGVIVGGAVDVGGGFGEEEGDVLDAGLAGGHVGEELGAGESEEPGCAEKRGEKLHRCGGFSFLLQTAMEDNFLYVKEMR